MFVWDYDDPIKKITNEVYPSNPTLKDEIKKNIFLIIIDIN
jgi:hypothetical protein